jgi:hypothetical protein
MRLPDFDPLDGDGSLRYRSNELAVTIEAEVSGPILSAFRVMTPCAGWTAFDGHAAEPWPDGKAESWQETIRSSSPIRRQRLNVDRLEVWREAGPMSILGRR